MKTVINIIEYIKGLKNNKFFKNYLAFILTLFLGFSVFAAYAQTSDTTTSTTDTVCVDSVQGYKETIGVSQKLNNDTASNTETTFAGSLQGGMETALKALDPGLNCNSAKLQASNLSTFSKEGIIGSVDGATIALYQNLPAVNLPSYFAQEWVPNYNQGSGSVYAANDGYSFLVGIGIDKLWEQTRTIAYILFVIVLLVAGFMIMFRQKIGGQVAVSLFNALPNVIVGLILVTFSFAIVGLFLNLGVMLVNVVGALLDPSSKDLISVSNPFSLMAILVNGSYWKALGGQIATTFGAGGVVGAIVGGIIAATSATAATGGVFAVAAAGAGVGLGIGLLVVVIIVCAIVAYASIRVYITLLVAYLSIILDTIIGPIVLSLASIPGNQEMRNNWFKRLLKNALVFPVVFFFINLGLFILKNNINISFPSALTSGSFANGGTGQGAIGLLLRGIICIVLFFFAADSPKMLEDFIQVSGGKGTASAVEGMKKGLSKIPLIGGMLG